MINLYEVLDVCSDSDFDDYDFVRINNDHVALVISGNGGGRDAYKVLFRHVGDTECDNHQYELEIKKRGNQYVAAESVIKRSKFGGMWFDDSDKFDTLHTFDLTVPKTIDLVAEADFVDGKVVVMITGKGLCENEPEQPCEHECEQTKTKHCSLTDLVESILNESEDNHKDDDTPDYHWSTSEKYWLNGKKVSKEQFENSVGKDYWKRFNEQFKDLDKQFEAMNESFRSLNNFWNLTTLK